MKDPFLCRVLVIKKLLKITLVKCWFSLSISSFINQTECKTHTPNEAGGNFGLICKFLSQWIFMILALGQLDLDCSCMERVLGATEFLLCFNNSLVYVKY